MRNFFKQYLLIIVMLSAAVIMNLFESALSRVILRTFPSVDEGGVDSIFLCLYLVLIVVALTCGIFIFVRGQYQDRKKLSISGDALKLIGIFGRHELVNLILSRHNFNKSQKVLLLCGDAGMGKTAIGEALLKCLGERHVNLFNEKTILDFEVQKIQNNSIVIFDYVLEAKERFKSAIRDIGSTDKHVAVILLEREYAKASLISDFVLLPVNIFDLNKFPLGIDDLKSIIGNFLQQESVSISDVHLQKYATHLKDSTTSGLCRPIFAICLANLHKDSGEQDLSGATTVDSLLKLYWERSIKLDKLLAEYKGNPQYGQTFISWVNFARLLALMLSIANLKVSVSPTKIGDDHRLGTKVLNAESDKEVHSSTVEDLLDYLYIKMIPDMKIIRYFFSNSLYAGDIGEGSSQERCTIHPLRYDIFSSWVTYSLILESSKNAAFGREFNSRMSALYTEYPLEFESHILRSAETFQSEVLAWRNDLLLTREYDRYAKVICAIIEHKANFVIEKPNDLQRQEHLWNEIRVIDEFSDVGLRIELKEKIIEMFSSDMFKNSQFLKSISEQIEHEVNSFKSDFMTTSRKV